MMANSKIKDDRQFIFQLESEIFDYAIAEYIGHNALIIYIALCHHLQSNTDFPSLYQLATRCNLDKKAINQAVQVLMQYQLIEVSHQQDNKIYSIKSVQEAIQRNGWHKPSLVNVPIEEPEIVESEPPVSHFETPPEPPQLSTPPPIKNDVPPPASQNKPINTIAVKDCPYCDDEGRLRFIDQISGHFDMFFCDHEINRIKALAVNKKAKITSAKKGYEYPAGEPKKMPINYLPDPK
ncbi:helix-turn-helix domain-containing protein [Candidatus Parabeggiatoa sp. HSG14]|uniref:helix-turn-helix domain-containing protein n=1 Tax=Candidatus Parabeggiatoa sp. HSG14 TaxID=3055593 RepID=UPI0025A897D0|nr:helix-turn-helix domain-containing protein [Thiotrichales bacterium HSG14]